MATSLLLDPSGGGIFFKGLYIRDNTNQFWMNCIKKQVYQNLSNSATVRFFLEKIDYHQPIFNNNQKKRLFQQRISVGSGRKDSKIVLTK